MDWYAWLSKAGLTPAATYEYGLLFSENELEPADAPDFDHDLLKSMGVAVAKHRLEILKLARPRCLRRSSSSSSAASISRILAAVDRAARYVRSMVRRRGRNESSAALVLVPCQQQHHGVDYGSAAAAARAARPAGTGCRGSAATVHATKDFGSGVEDAVKWYRMFQELNPN